MENNILIKHYKSIYNSIHLIILLLKEYLEMIKIDIFIYIIILISIFIYIFNHLGLLMLLNKVHITFLMLFQDFILDC